MKSPVLLDIDMDFLLNTDANNGSNPMFGSKWQDRIKARISGKTLAKRLKTWLKPETKVFLCVDHHEALYWWDALKIKNATCFHIDAHHDCWSDDIIDKYDRSGAGCWNYLAQSMVDGIVRKMTYVPAFFRYVWEEQDDLGYQLKRVKITKRRWEVAHWKKFIQNKLKADVITICVSPEWFPKRFFSHFVAICQGLGVEKKHINKIYKTACDKWRDAKRGWRGPGEPVLGTHFKFPYFDKRQLTKVEVFSHRNV